MTPVPPDMSVDELVAAAVVEPPGTNSTVLVESEALSCPVLPAYARPDTPLASYTGLWIALYLKYAMQIAPMTPIAFHVSAALWLASLAIARRFVLNMAFATVFPNLYILWIAGTTLWNKSTALDIAQRLARQAFPHLLLPHDTTPESQLADMAGHEPANFATLPLGLQQLWQRGRDFAAQRGILLDEASGLLASAGKDYNAGLIEAFLKFYDCTDHVRSTMSKGWTVVRHPYVSLLGASTPLALSQHLLSERLWAMGWWPRFALLTPETERPSWRVATDVEQPTELVTTLQTLHQDLPTPAYPDPPEQLSLSLGSGVMDQWQGYNQALRHDLLTPDLDHRLHGTYGRLPTTVLKVAMLVASLDWAANKQRPRAPTVELPHLAWAISTVEDWRFSAHRVLATARESEYDRLSKRIIYQVSKHHPDGMTMRDIYKSMGDKKPDEIESAVRQMIKAGDLQEEPAPPGSKGGRPTSRIKLG